MLDTWLEAALLYSLENSGGTLGARGECSTVHEERRSSLKAFCRAQFAKHIFELLLRYYPLRLKGQYSEMVELQLVLLLRQLLLSVCLCKHTRLCGSYWSLPWFLVFLQDAIDIARFLLIVFFLVPQALSVSLLDLMTCATELFNCHLKLKATFTVYMQLKSTAQSSAQPAGSLWNAHHLKWFFSLIRVFQLLKKTHVHRYIWSPNLCNLQFGKLQTVGQIWHKGQLKVWLRQWSRLVNGAN